jgi:tRNA(fMet)-specific endonuclease VapC
MMKVSAGMRMLISDVFGHLTISAITVTELVDGFARMQREDRIGKLSSELNDKRHECLELDYPSATIAGRIFGALHRLGQPIGNADPFIAAIAIHEGIPLVTGNTKHFERIQAAGFQLHLETWRAPAT